jgi:hypothetical protein
MAKIRILVEKGPNVHDVIKIILLELICNGLDCIHKSVHNSFGYFCDILRRLILLSNLFRVQYTVTYAH